MKRIAAAALALLTVLTLIACRRGAGGTDPQSDDVSTAKERKDPVAEAVNDTNALSTYGRIARYNGYTYFASLGKLSDAQETGYIESDDIYRIKDGANEAELVLSLPASVAEGSSWLSVMGIVPYGDSVYFLKADIESDGYVLCRTTAGSGKYEKLDLVTDARTTFRMNSYNAIGNRLYVQTSKYDESSEQMVYGFSQVDLKTGKVSEFKPDLGTDEQVRVVSVSDDGYVYFLKFSSGEPYGLFRAPASGGKSEDVTPLPDDVNGLFVSQGRVFIGLDDTIRVIDVKTGNKISEFAYDDDEPFNVSGDTFYRIKDGGLYAMALDGSGEREIAPGRDGFRIMTLGVSGDSIFFLDDDLLVYRMDKSGRILPGNPIVAKTERPEEKKTDDGFLYLEWDKAVEIVNYQGGAKTVSIPAQINGKPVRKIELFSAGSAEPEKIIIPEGVYSAVVYSSRSVTEVELPSTLAHMNYRGFPYSFECAKGCTFRYNGTTEQWQKLYDFCRTYHYCTVDTHGTEDPIVKCSDGEWKLP